MTSFTGAANRRPIDVESAPNCPRCASSSTKFCYFNNYSLPQPRYFCKSCRRYWTKGGTMRNVPVGGGCRKSRRSGKKDIPSAVDNDRADKGGMTVAPVNIPMTSWGIDGGKADTWDLKSYGGDDLIHNQVAQGFDNTHGGESSRQMNGIDFADLGYQESTVRIQDYDLVWHDDDQPLFSNTWSFDFSG